MCLRALYQVDSSGGGRGGVRGGGATAESLLESLLSPFTFLPGSASLGDPRRRKEFEPLWNPVHFAAKSNLKITFILFYF